MHYEIIATPKFEKDIKHYKKKFRSVADDVDDVVEELEKGNLQGDIIPNLEMKDNENNIVKVDRHNQYAYLDLSFMDRRIKVGLNITCKN